MGGFDDITEKGSDAAIDRGGDLADQKFAGHEDKIDKAQDAADDRIGSGGDSDTSR